MQRSRVANELDKELTRAIKFMDTFIDRMGMGGTCWSYIITWSLNSIEIVDNS